MDRTEHRDRLRQALPEFQVPLPAGCRTSSQSRLLVEADAADRVSRMTQKLEGEFAEGCN
jgi:hypothetical protein